MFNLSKPNLGFPNPNWVSKIYTEHKMVLYFMGFIINTSNVLQTVKFHRLKNKTQACKLKLGFLSYDVIKSLGITRKY
jgi:hypothetical protein